MGRIFLEGFWASPASSLMSCLRNALPTKITSYRQFQRKFPKQGAELNINIVSSSKHAASADIEILDKQNKLLARIEGYECVIDSSLNNAFKKNTLEVPAKA